MTIHRNPDNVFTRADVKRYYKTVYRLNLQGTLFGTPKFETRRFIIKFERGEPQEVKEAFSYLGTINDDETKEIPK